MNTEKDNKQAVTVEDAMRVLRADYWKDVRDAAGELVQMARDEWDNGNGSTGEALREYMLEQVWKYCDGHQRAIYTRDAMLTLLFSDNDSYAVDELGINAADGNGVNWSALAFGAFYADVLDQLDAELNGGINDAGEWFGEDDTTDE